jgi:hypothetical protein
MNMIKATLFSFLNLRSNFLKVNFRLLLVDIELVNQYIQDFDFFEILSVLYEIDWLPIGYRMPVLRPA